MENIVATVRPLVRPLVHVNLFEHGIEGASDDESANFTRARTDFIQLGVPQEASHGVVVDVAVTACW